MSEKQTITPKFNFPVECNYVFAFTSGETNYFEPADSFDTPNQRGLSALSIYEEVRQRVTRESLMDYLATQKKIKEEIKKEFTTANGRLNLAKVFDLIKDSETLDNHLNEKLQFIAAPDIMYKLASVVYVDETENPNVYDFRYGMKKVEKWKKDQSTKDFFLQKPLVRLIPYLKDLNENFQIVLDVMSEMEKNHQQVHTSIKSKLGLTTGSVNASRSPVGSPSN